MNVKVNPEIELPPVQTAEPKGELVALEQNGGTLVSLMAKMATDPNCDVEKFERLVRLSIEVEKLRCDEILSRQFNEAMSRAQAKMSAIAKDKDNSQTRSKYASYAALDRIVRPIYTNEGFSLSFNEGETAKPDYVRVLCDVALGGYARHYHVDMPADGKGAKGGDVMTRTHATGSAFTYGQRNLLKLIFNLATIDADDDGNRAGATGNDPPVSEEQADKITKLLQETKTNVTKFLKWAKAESVSDIRAAYFQDCVTLLEKKKAEAK